MNKIGIWLSTFWLALLLMSPVAYIAPTAEEMEAEIENSPSTPLNRVQFTSSQKNKWCSQCPDLFDDSVRRHARSYRWDGISAKGSMDELEKLHKAGILEEIKTNAYFEVEDLTYSVPYLLPIEHHLSALLLTCIQIIICFQIVRIISAFLNVFKNVYSNKAQEKYIPLNSSIQIIQLVIYLVAIIFAVSLIIGKSPIYLLSGLGALTAVLILVFQDNSVVFHFLHR